MTDLPLEAEEHLTWLAAERGRSKNTLAAYRRDLAQYAAWLGGRSLRAVEPADLEAYVGHLRDEGRAPSSVARHRPIASKFSSANPTGSITL